MKFSAAILLQIMLVLTTLPLTHDLFAAKKNICMDKCNKMCTSKQKHKTGNETPCSNNSCNPFLSCSFCSFIYTERLMLTDIFSQQNNRFNILRNVNLVSSYHAECWHPPELI